MTSGRGDEEGGDMDPGDSGMSGDEKGGPLLGNCVLNGVAKGEVENPAPGPVRYIDGRTYACL